MRVLFTTRDTRPTTYARSGFTILELMVVIGIITILIGIVLPAVRGVQKAAKNATTTNLLNTIASAIDQYQSSAQRDWPGPFDTIDDRLDASAGNWDKIFNPVDKSFSDPFQAKTGAVLKVTRSEELLLCLVGGMAVQRENKPPFNVTGTNFFYEPEDLDRGHILLSAKNRGRMKPFLPAGTARSDTKANAMQFANDSLVPEFIDAYGSAILYVRARKGAGTIVDPGAGLVTTAYYTYNSGGAVINGGQLYYEALRYAPANAVLFPPSYCKNASLPNQVVNQDRYILVSPGADKKYGTSDDIANFTPTFK